MEKMTKYKNDFNREHYDRIGLMLPKGLKDVWKKEAKARGLSINALIIEAVKWYLENWSNGEETDQK